MNKSIVIFVIFLVLVGGGVSRLKYEVVFLRKTLKTLTKETEKCMDNIKVLEAEWSYLNRPDRLKKLATKYLPDMKPVSLKQVMLYNSVISSDLVSTKVQLSLDTKNNKRPNTEANIKSKKLNSSFDSLLDKVVGKIDGK